MTARGDFGARYDSRSGASKASVLTPNLKRRCDKRAVLLAHTGYIGIKA